MRAEVPTPDPRRSVRTVTFATACTVSALLYASWVVGPAVNPGIDEVSGYVSELSARDQPASSLFRAGDSAAGVLAVVAAVLGMRRNAGGEAPRGVAGTAALTGWFALALFGAATAVDAALTPMDCATFSHSGCALREAFGGVSTAHHLHAASSTLAGTGALIGMAALGLASRYGVARLPSPGTALVLSAIMATATTATLVALLTGGWVGVFQRLQLAAVSAWLLWLAVVSRRAVSRGGS